MIYIYRGRRMSASVVMLGAASLLVVACGGGGSTPTPPPEPVTPVPASLSIAAAATGDIAEAVGFSNSAATLSRLTFRWDFGDGAVSAEASPSHQFTRPGDYVVKLTVSNSAGESREVSQALSVNNQAAVRGLICSGQAANGWCWQMPRPTGHPTKAIRFANVQTAWAVGTHGQILKSVDGGATWVRQNSGTTADLFEVQFFDANNGWALGDAGLLLSTSDGGSTWTRMPAAPAASFINSEVDALTVVSAKTLLLQVRDPRTGVLKAHVSDDRGQSWRPAVYDLYRKVVRTKSGQYLAVQGDKVYRTTDLAVAGDAVLDLKDESGKSPEVSYAHAAGDRGLIVTSLYWRYSNSDAAPYYEQVYRRTTDDGATWATWSLGIRTWNFGGENIAALSADGSVLLKAGAPLQRSEDGGRTWAPVDIAGAVDPTPVVIGSRVYLGGSSVRLSEDLGKTWRSLATPDGTSSFTLRRFGPDVLAFLDRVRGFVVSTEGPGAWRSIGLGASTSPIVQLCAVFLDAKRGLSINEQGDLYASADGGKSWQLKRSKVVSGGPGGVQPAFGLQVVGKTLFMVGSDLWLYKGEDLGDGWLGSLGNTRYRQLSFFDESNGWMQGMALPQAFFVTRDGAKTWTTVETPAGTQALRIDGGTSIDAVGDNGLIARSSDAGKTWERKSGGTSATLRKAYSLDGKVVWAIGDGGAVVRSTDAGATWAVVGVPSLENLNDLQFLDKDKGWIVGDAGTVLVTTDGGKTWVRQEAGTSKHLRRVQFVDARTGWILGDEGTLLATGNGGF